MDLPWPPNQKGVSSDGKRTYRLAWIEHGGVMSKPNDISVRIDGSTYSGAFHAEDGMVSVISAYGSKRGAVGDARPETAAAALMREIVADYATRPRARF